MTATTLLSNEKFELVFKEILKKNGIIGAQNMDIDSFDEFAIDSKLITFPELDDAYSKFKDFIQTSRRKYELG